MLSVVMVGRNDDYGYKNQERTAICLNGWSQVLDTEDEIIFVDWASPTRKTLPEQIRHELYSQTQERLRVLRVDPSDIPAIEKRWERRAMLPVLEPHGRNLGIRLAKQPWVLSTNTDIVPLSIYPWVRLLNPEAWYLSRPFLVTEDDWERHRDVRWISRRAKLHVTREIVDPRMPHAKVGDFQLATREAWADIKGFEEGMSFLWGHSDSNVCIKLDRELGAKPQIITAMMTVFHLNHDSKGNNFSTFPHNDEKTWITDFTTTQNDETWGLIPYEEIEV